MTNINKYLKTWLNDLEGFKFPKYEEYPEFDLYMEQMMSFLDRQMAIYQTSSLDKQITSSMINNYVKGNVISSPIAKKYTREHISSLDEVCILKQVLSINEVKLLLDETYVREYRGDVFNRFNEQFIKEKKIAILEANNALEHINEDDTKALANLALELSLKAEANLAIAKRLLFMIKHYNNDNKK